MSVKHSRTEFVKSTVCAYLKRRQYTDSEVFLKSELQLCQTKQQLAVLGAVNKEAANKNSITFSSFVFDFSVVDQHFSRLKAWISRLSGPVQKELFGVLPPLLCHLTIDLLRWNVVIDSSPLTVSSAKNFLKKHVSSLLIEDTFGCKKDGIFGSNFMDDESDVYSQSFCAKDWTLLEELLKLENCWDLCKSKSLLLFRSCKYRLKLSSEAVALLQKYLVDHAHVCLIQAIGTWFDVIEVPDSDCAHEGEDDDDDDDDELVVQLWEEGVEDRETVQESCDAMEVSVAVNGCEEESSSNVDGGESLARDGRVAMQQQAGAVGREMGAAEGEEEKQLRLLDAAIQSVREGPSPQNPLLLYSVQNSDDNVICTKVSEVGDLLAVGFGTSDIKVWGLTEGGLPTDVREMAGGSGFVFNKERKRTARLACDFASLPFERDAFSAVEEEEEDWSASPVLLRGHCGSVQDIGLSGHLLFSCSTDTTLRAWNLKDHSCLAIYRGHCHPIWCLDICAWGLYMASGSQDRTARLWSPERAFPLRTYAGHGLDVDCIRFHPNGLYLATGSCDHSVRLWSVAEGKLVRVFPHSTRSRASSLGSRSTSHLSSVVTALAFSPDGKYLASGAEDQRIRIWDLAAGSMMSELSLPSSISSSTLDVAAQNSNEEMTSPSQASVGAGPGSVSGGLCWSPGGERLACGFRNGTVAVWEAKEGRWAEFLASGSHSVSANPMDDSGAKGSAPSGSHSRSILDALTTYSTGMRPLTSLRYIEKSVLVAVGCTPPSFNE